MNPEPTEVTVSYSDGRSITLKRCGVLPDLFASRNGDIFHCEKLHLTEHQGNAIARYRNTSVAVRHLVADAWRPGWERQFRTVVLEDRNAPLDCSLDNLIFSSDTRRGRPRSTKMQDEIMLARAAAQCGNLQVAADEFDATEQEVIAAVLKWFPDELINMEGVPENWLESKAARDSAARAHAIERRRQLQAAARRAERANLVEANDA